MDHLALTKGYLVKCNYGIDDESVFQIHLIGFLLTIPVAFLLLWNTNLRRFYTPLARIVNASIMVTLISSLVFFWYWNYSTADSNFGNCGEIFLSRLATICIMFGELHQVYVVAHSLGLGHMQISISHTRSFSLELMLTVATFLVIGSVLLSYFFFRDSLMVIEHAWTVYVSLAQLYIIYVARSSRESLRDIAVMNVNDTSVTIFEKMSIIQVILSGICMVYRLGTDFFSARMFGNIEVTLSVLDQVCTLLFYIKTLMIKERTNVNVSMA